MHSNTNSNTNSNGIPLIFHDIMKKHIVDIQYSNHIIFEYTTAIGTSTDRKHSSIIPYCCSNQTQNQGQEDPDVVLTWVDVIEEQLSAALYPSESCM